MISVTHRKPDNGVQRLISNLAIAVVLIPTLAVPVQGLEPVLQISRSPAYHPTRILVRFRSDPSSTASSTQPVESGHRLLHSFRSVSDLSVVEVAPGDVDAAIERYRANPSVQYAEPDYRLVFSATPNDTLFESQWGLHNTGQTVDNDPGTAGVDLRARWAWEHWIGDPIFRIAVIDTGIDHTHADLADNIWKNPGEIARNGLDDDGNGWVDDVHGYNTAEDNGETLDATGHGTHVAGAIAAVGDNDIGISGVMWDAGLVAIRITDDDGISYVSDAVEAIEYVIDNGIQLSSNSWGCYDCYSQSLYDMIEASQAIGHVFVAAAGNGFFNVGVDTDRFPFYPSSYDLWNIISVTAVDNDGQKPKFANFGRAGVDLAAPGLNILSTTLGDEYAFFDGTSVATGYATGVAGLLMSRRHDLSATNVIDRILLTTRPLESLRGITVTGGMIDAESAVVDCNRNQIPDEFDILNRGSVDCNANGVPDECEPDCNGNGTADRCDIRDGVSEDCDGGGVPDECEFDCNANGIADSCDLTRGTSDDCNNDGVPDECQPNHDRDCNGNGQPDLCDLYLGAGRDCNDNLTLDECDISEGASEDCSGNGLPDECERDCNDNGIADSCDIVSGTSTDLDGDAVPDECVLGFSLVPIGATKPHLIEDRTIFVIGGGERVTFEIRVSGWDPDQDGDPRLRTYQAAIDVNGYTSGQTGSLSRARITCSDNDDCIAATECLSDGYCEPAAALAIDESHLLFVFAGKATVSLSDPSRNRLGSTVFFAAEAPIDPGSSRYVGTVILDVSPDALGTFTIPFNPLDTFLRDNSDMPGSINIPGFRPAYVTIMPDCNENGVPDARDILDETSGDCDGNGVPDECVPVENDCNDNRLPDVCDIAEGVSEDCNKNGIPDECIQFELDCNHNNAPDRCDIDRGDSPDCNDNNIPDECMALEDDCNENNIPDACDIIDGTSNDCDQSGVPDSCEIDCNGNGFADSCDIADGVSLDRDENGVPDECQTVLWVPFEFATIQDAIDAADNGDVVRVADGVYSGDGNRDIDLSGKVVSVLSANGPANCIIDATGGQTGFVLISGETSSTRVEGFTITNASIAGIVVFEGSPIIRNCIITGNGPTAGGIYCDRDAAPLIEHCVITENSSSWEGGGVRSVRSSPRIRYCTISRNIARLEGGGIYAFSGSMTVTHTTIADNVGREGGGGIAVRAGQPVIRSCRILGNLASSGTGTLGSGGGIMTVRTDATIASSLIAGNYARAFGGGIYLEDGDPTVTNCTIVGNVAESYGGGVHRPGGLGNQWACCHSDFCEDALTHAECAAVGGSWYPAIRCVDVECGTTSCCLEGGECRNMDFFTCAADGGNPGFNGSQCVLSDCTPTISNSVLWDNEAQIGSEIYSGILPLGVVNSTVRNGWSGADNVDTDPGFLVAGYWDEEDIWIDGDYHLDPASDGVDSGDNGAVPPTVVADLDGHPRILCNRVDRGAYERGIGDFNCDQRIDLDDFRYWVNCITGPTGGDYASGCQSFDFDADGDVDLSDFGAYQLETRN